MASASASASKSTKKKSGIEAAWRMAKAGSENWP